MRYRQTNLGAVGGIWTRLSDPPLKCSSDSGEVSGYLCRVSWCRATGEVLCRRGIYGPSRQKLPHSRFSVTPRSTPGCPSAQSSTRTTQHSSTTSSHQSLNFFLITISYPTSVILNSFKVSYYNVSYYSKCKCILYTIASLEL